MEKQIVATSLRYGVLSRFTAFVAVDHRVVNEGGQVHKVTQPVDLPSGWEPPAAQPGAPLSPAPMMAQAFGGAPAGFVQGESRMTGFAPGSAAIARARQGGDIPPPQPPLSKPAPPPDFDDYGSGFMESELSSPPTTGSPYADAITPPVVPPPAGLLAFVTRELQQLKASSTADVQVKAGLLTALAQRIRAHLSQWESANEPQAHRLALAQLSAHLATPTAYPAEITRRWTHAITTLTTLTTHQQQQNRPTRRAFWKR
jgi:Ca-activated chloride channel family protein